MPVEKKILLIRYFLGKIFNYRFIFHEKIIQIEFTKIENTFVYTKKRQKMWVCLQIFQETVNSRKKIHVHRTTCCNEGLS